MWAYTKTSFMDAIAFVVDLLGNCADVFAVIEPSPPLPFRRWAATAAVAVVVVV